MNTKKIFIKVLSVVIILTTGIIPESFNLNTTISVSAASKTASGKCGKKAKWELYSDGTFKVKGSGDMENYIEPGDCPWEAQKEDIKEISIDDGITSIGFWTFSNCKNLKTVNIPKSVKAIEYGAFAGCTGLEDFDIPNNIESINSFAFSGCTGLKKFVVPSGLGHDVFFNCTGLESVTFEDDVEYIPSDTFLGCTNLNNVTVPEGIKDMGHNAFDNCTKLEKITILNPDCSIYNADDTIYSETVIYGYENSTAQAYAEKYNRKFEVINPDRIIVSLGDSYSSGEGIPDFYGWGSQLYTEIAIDPKSETCQDWLAHRSTKSWSGQLKLSGIDGTMADHRNENWYFVASSGAVVSNFTNTQNKEYDLRKRYEKYYSEISNTDNTTVDKIPASQLIGKVELNAQFDIFDKLKEENKTEDIAYVTLTIGGNDIHFTEVITEALTLNKVLHPNKLINMLNETWREFDDYYDKDEKKEGLKTRLFSTYKSIQEQTGKETKIIIAGYPKLLNPNGGKMLPSFVSLTNKGKVVSKLFEFSPETTKLINDNILLFNEKIHEIVDDCRVNNGMNIYFVSVDDEDTVEGDDNDICFGGHEAYTDNEYINKVRLLLQEQDLLESKFPPISDYSIHPNVKGSRTYANAVQKQIDELEENGIISGFIYDSNKSEKVTPYKEFSLDIDCISAVNVDTGKEYTYQFNNRMLEIDSESFVSPLPSIKSSRNFKKLVVDSLRDYSCFEIAVPSGKYKLKITYKDGTYAMADNVIEIDNREYKRDQNIYLDELDKNEFDTESVYYDYIKNKLIPQYGLASTEPFTIAMEPPITLDGGSVYGMFNKNYGIVDIDIDDYDGDGNKEMLVLSLEEEYDNEHICTIVLSLYGINGETVSLYDSKKIHKYPMESSIEHCYNFFRLEKNGKEFILTNNYFKYSGEYSNSLINMISLTNNKIENNTITYKANHEGEYGLYYNDKAVYEVATNYDDAKAKPFISDSKKFIEETLTKNGFVNYSVGYKGYGSENKHPEFKVTFSDPQIITEYTANYNYPKESMIIPNSYTDFREKISALYEENNITASGSCGEKSSWELDKNGRLRVFGEGTTYFCPTVMHQPWYSYSENIKEIVIEDGITEFGWNIFSNCKNLNKVTIADSVECMGRYAFAQCDKLESIIIPENVKSIDRYSFGGCESLKSITIMNKDIHIDNWISIPNKECEIIFNGTVDQWKKAFNDPNASELSGFKAKCTDGIADPEKVRERESEPSEIREINYNDYLGKVKLNSGYLNVRQEPNTNGKIIGKLQNGEYVKLEGKTDDEKWYKINIDGKYGYVSADYIILYYQGR